MGETAGRVVRRVGTYLGRRPTWPLGAALALALAAYNPWWSIRVNFTPSVRYHVLVVRYGAPITRGDYVAFRWAGPTIPGHAAGEVFVKRVAGVGGDVVSVKGRAFFVNDAPVGIAKTNTRNGLALALGVTGTLPTSVYYVQGEHPDSFDSRYKLVGWVTRSQIVGKAYGLF